MHWIDIDGYVGPDRRNRGGARLLERRRFNAAREAPSLAALLRQLQIKTLDVQFGDAAALANCRARVEAIAALARGRGESGAALWLESLGERMRAIDRGAARMCVGDLINRYVQSAMAALK